MIGRVVSTKMKNTATVLVETTKTHPLYKKTYLGSKKYLVDDPIGVKTTDLVEFEKIKPISKRKHWRIVKVVGRNIKEMVQDQLKEKAKQAVEEVMPVKEKELSEDKTSTKRKGGRAESSK